MKKALILLTLLPIPFLNYAATIDVPTDYTTIQLALDNAAYGDVIQVDNSVVYSENIVWPAVNGITLTGWNGSNYDYVTIDGSSFGSVITIQATTTAITSATVLKFLRLINGYAQYGAGIKMVGYVGPILENLIIEENTAINNGGGIYLEPYMTFSQNSCYTWHNLQSAQCNNLSIRFNNAGTNNSSTGQGGGIYIQGIQQSSCSDCCPINTDYPSMTIANCLLYGNKANGSYGGLGGGICIVDAFIEIFDSKIIENYAYYKGGGILSKGGRTNIGGCEIKGNTAVYGGGIFLHTGLHRTINNADCTPFDGIEHRWNTVDFSANQAGIDGGGIYVNNEDFHTEEYFLDIDYQRGHLYGNNCDSNGGAIYVERASRLHLFDLQFSYNYCQYGDGGAIYNNCFFDTVTGQPSTPEHNFDQLLINENVSSNGYGGGIFTKQSFVCINSTIVSNEALIDGAGIACATFNGINGNPQIVSPVFLNSIIFYNHYFAGPPNQIYLDTLNCIPQFNYCNIEYYSQSLHGFTGDGNTSWYNLGWSCGSLMLDTSPLFINQSGDYHLSGGSPCIDNGHNSYCLPNNWQGSNSNYFGFPWTSDFLSVNLRILADTIDMGVYEYATKSSLITPLVNIHENSSLQIIPNPSCTDQIVGIELSNPNATILTTHVFDLTGNLILSKNGFQHSNYKISINQSDGLLKPGLYFVTVDFINELGELKKAVKRLIKI